MRASDFRPSVERLMRLGGGVGALSGIVVADKCRPDKKCDLSSGISADDGAGTITIRLKAPDSEFLHGLAVEGSMVPARAANLPADSPLVPGTGPYRISSFEPRSEIRLVRNPHFRVWSHDARPDGYPDEIRFRLRHDPAAGLAAVERGSADWTSLLTAGVPASRQRGVLSRYSDRLHTDLAPGTFWVFLNTAVPPFNDVRVRRALNYAIDRQGLIDLVGGRARLRPSCQMLPPTLPGYRPYCPYTRNPTRAGTWSAPDMAKARALVAASGTAGSRVEFVVNDWPLSGTVGHYFQNLLRRLGFRARVIRIPASRILARYGDSRTRTQLGPTGWIADRLLTSNFFTPLFTCRAFTPKSGTNTNFSEYCNRRLDAKIDQATATESTDPTRAASLWAEIDRMVVDDAIGLPWGNPRNAALVSKRVGNYQSHPLLGTLLDQLWVK